MEQAADRASRQHAAVVADLGLTPRDPADAVSGQDPLHADRPAVFSTQMIWSVVGPAALMGIIWLLVVMRLGVWRGTLQPADGVLSYTFQGWETLPVSRHAFTADFDGTRFVRGYSYTSYSYPFLFAMFVGVAPVRFLLDVPYNLAHNVMAYSSVAALGILLIVTARRELLAIARAREAARWLLAFIAVGMVVTNPLPWISLLRYNRETLHIVAAGVFCYLSVLDGQQRLSSRALRASGVLLALWAPIFIPAWLLARVYFRRTPRFDRPLLTEAAAICLLGAVNMILPVAVSRMIGVHGGGSGFLYRSGLDGSVTYLSSILQAVLEPVDPRHWPTGVQVVVTVLAAAGFQRVMRNRSGVLPLEQTAFLAIPYATIAILLPQYTSIHPYMTDLLIAVPSGFMLAYWLLQEGFWNALTARTFVATLLGSAFVIMTNLLAIAQVFRLRE